MSIYQSLISGAIVLSFSTPVFAVGTEAAPQAVAPAPLGVMVAQNSRTFLSDSDLRRINHYSTQTLEALQALDASTFSDSAVATLRQRVQRLVDAGQRSGMDLIQTADYFEAYLTTNNDGPLPGALLDADGRFNARSLFTATMLFLENNAAQPVDVAAVEEADLAAIGSVAQRVTPQAPVEQTIQLSVTVLSDTTPALPAIAANAPANVRAILERVQLKGDLWVITVKPGDSLGQFANALYGDTLFFQRIYQVNLDKISTPNSITVGQELVLPKS